MSRLLRCAGAVRDVPALAPSAKTSESESESAVPSSQACVNVSEVSQAISAPRNIAKAPDLSEKCTSTDNLSLALRGARMDQSGIEDCCTTFSLLLHVERRSQPYRLVEENNYYTCYPTAYSLALLLAPQSRARSAARCS